MRARIELRRDDFLIVAAAVLGAQRFLLPGLDTLACLLPFTLALLCFRTDTVKRNTFLLMALFLSVDNGAGGYPETSSLIRYPLYLASLYALVREASFSLRRGRLFLAFFVFMIFAAAVQADVVRSNEFYHDAAFAVLLGMLWMRSEDSLASFRLDLDRLNVFFLVFMACELVNFFFLYSPQNGHYLSYNSTKTFVLFPFFYLLAGGRRWLALPVLAVTMFVLVGYGTRMIPMMLVLALLTYVAAKVFRGPFALVKLGLVVGVLFLGLQFSHWLLADGTNDSYKILFFVHRLFFEVDSLEAFRIVDPVRYDEHVMFFSRSWWRIFVGDGFGSGLKDVGNLMAGVKVDQTAFTADEINSGIFYGLHDMWTDIGLRFGLALILAVLFWVVGQFRKDNNREVVAYALLLFVLVNCAFFATAGIIATSIVALALRNSARVAQVSTAAVGLQ